VIKFKFRNIFVVIIPSSGLDLTANFSKRFFEGRLFSLFEVSVRDWMDELPDSECRMKEELVTAWSKRANKPKLSQKIIIFVTHLRDHLEACLAIKEYHLISLRWVQWHFPMILKQTW